MTDSLTLPLPEVKPSLPSAEYAFRLVKGDMKALPGVVGTTAFRAALIGSGIALVSRHGVRKRHLVRNSVAGAVMVEAFVMLYQLMKIRRWV